MRNILIVFAKLNPGIRYVQGMNEILAQLFYVFRNDPDEEMAVRSHYLPYPVFIIGINVFPLVNLLVQPKKFVLHLEPSSLFSFETYLSFVL